MVFKLQVQGVVRERVELHHFTMGGMNILVGVEKWITLPNDIVKQCAGTKEKSTNQTPKESLEVNISKEKEIKEGKERKRENKKKGI